MERSDRKPGSGFPLSEPNANQLPPAGAVPFAKSACGLWLPKYLAEVSSPGELVDERPEILRFAITTVGWQSVTGEESTISQVVQRLRRYSLRRIIGFVGRITLVLNEELDGLSEDNETRQFAAAELFLGRESARRVFELVAARQEAELDQGGFALFHERQTLNALKLAFLVQDLDVPDDASDKSPVPFIEALLMLNDLIDPAEGSMGPAAPGGRDAMELYISANTLFCEAAPVLRDFVRSYHLYVEARPEIGIPSAVDIPAAVERATGLPAQTVWRALYILYTAWCTRSSDDVLAGRIATSKTDYLASLPRLTPDERELWFGLATWEARELQARIRQDFTLEEPRYWDVLLFEQRPLVAVDDLVFCSSIPLLRRMPGSSFQHRLQDRTVFAENETSAFRTTRGHIVERYTIDLLTRVFGDRFVPELALQRCAGGRSVCDGIIVYPDALILIECKSSSPPLYTRHATNYSAHRAQWAATMTKAATQIDSTLELLRSGAFAPLGLLDDSSREKFPVVSVFEQAVHPLLYRSIREVDLQGHSLSSKMQTGEVMPLQLFHIKEVEMWESGAEVGKSLLELLREKTSDERTVEISFHHFLETKGETFQKKHSEWFVSRFRAIADEARDFVRRLGLSVPESLRDADATMNDVETERR